MTLPGTERAGNRPGTGDEQSEAKVDFVFAKASFPATHVRLAKAGNLLQGELPMHWRWRGVRPTATVVNAELIQ